MKNLVFHYIFLGNWKSFSNTQHYFVSFSLVSFCLYNLSYLSVCLFMFWVGFSYRSALLCLPFLYTESLFLYYYYYYYYYYYWSRLSLLTFDDIWWIHILILGATLWFVFHVRLSVLLDRNLVFVSFQDLPVTGSQSPFTLFASLLLPQVFDSSAPSLISLSFPSSFWVFLFVLPLPANRSIAS